jgi:hypothetical protein
MKFNPNEYETVKERKERFYKDHPEGRIDVKLINQDSPLDFALFRAEIYLSPEDQEKGLYKATGYALEVRDKELSVSNSGKEYESVNYSSWTENCEESAVGRALDNAGYSGNKKPSREEMNKASKMNKTMKTYNEDRPASAKQKKYVTDLMREKGVTIAEMTDKYDLKDGDKLTATQASDAIKWLQSIKDVKESK